jgi:hypothetical protein
LYGLWLLCRVSKIGNLVRINNYLANFRIHKIQNFDNKSYLLTEHEEIMRRYIPKNTGEWNLKYKNQSANETFYDLYNAGWFWLYTKGAMKDIKKIGVTFEIVLTTLVKFVIYKP